MVDKPLITKYRPQDWDELIGHEEIVVALKRALDSDTSPHAFLLTGPSGTGKTTISRIICKHLNAEIMEIDAASNSGVDEVRQLVEFSQHIPMSGKRRGLIIDECHALSKTAWQALLKLLEEPPAHLYIMLCTTELQKIIETIRTRCFHVALKSLRPKEIEDLVTLIAEVEQWEIDGDVLGTIVTAATGQPRKALSILQAVHDAKSREEVARILVMIEGSEPLIELAKLIITNPGESTWKRAQDLLAKIEDDEYEQAAIGMGRYIGAIMVKADAAQARKCYAALDALIYPAATYDRKIAFVTAIARLFWG